MFKSYFVRQTMEDVTTDRLAAARAAAKLKREKKAAAAAARIQGKIAAQEAREKMAETQQIKMINIPDHEQAIQAKIAKARKALGLRKNDENPAALCRLIEEWRMQARICKWTHIRNCTSDCN